jgi:hypothetical protein
MRLVLRIVSLMTVALVFQACTKKETEAPSAPTPTAETSPSPAPQPGTPVSGGTPVNVSAELNSANQALQQRNYDAAVDALAKVQPTTSTMSDAQRLQYAQQVRNTSELLIQAMGTDPKAKAAYEKLGRNALGR